MAKKSDWQVIVRFYEDRMVICQGCHRAQAMKSPFLYGVGGDFVLEEGNEVIEIVELDEDGEPIE